MRAERIEVEEDGEQITYVINPETRKKIHESCIHQMLLRDVMLHEIGFTSWDIEVDFIEQRYFSLKA